MRAARRAAALCLLAGCGGGATTSPPPPPPPPPPAATPASAAISAGDQQTAAAGTAVPVAPAVVVRDAQGRVLSGVAVQFSVASGGGTADGTAATTDASGIARIGKWTLGPSGDQRLSAQVGSLPAVSFQASIEPGTEILDVTFGPGPGSFAITTPGHPYRGFKMTVPAGTFASAGTWSFRTATNPVLPALPAGLTVAGPVLEVSTDQGRGGHLVTIDVPVNRTGGKAVVIAFRDPARGALEILPAVAVTDSSVRVMTAHLNAGLLLGPAASNVRAAPAAEGPTAAAALGIAIGQLVPIELVKPLLPVAPVVDGAERWPVLENGSWFSPDGHGPAIPAFEALASADGGSALGSLFQGLGTPGVYPESGPIAALIRSQERLNLRIPGILNEFLTEFEKLTASDQDQLTANAFSASLSAVGHSLATLLKPVVGDPLYANVVSTDGGNSFGLFHPALEALGSLVHAEGSGFQPLAVKGTIDGITVGINQVLALPSFLAPFEEVSDLLAKLRVNATLSGAEREAANLQMAAEAGMPGQTLSTEAYPGAGSTPVHGMHVSVRGLLDALNLDLDQVGGNVSVLAHLVETGVFAQLGPDGLLPLAELLNRTATKPGARRPFALVSMLAAGGHLKQIGATTLEIENAPFAVSPDTAYFDGPVPEVSFTSDLPDPPSSYRIQWAWGDGKTTDNLGLPNASHRYDAEGDYTIQVKLLDGDGVAVAIDTVYALSGRPYWQITSISDPDEFLDLGDAGQSGPTYDLILRLLNAPKSGLIAVDRPDTATSVLRLRVLNAAVWDSSTCCPPAAPVPGEVREDLGISPAQATGVGPWFTGWEMNTWTQSTPSLGSGTMMGRHILGTTVYNVIDAGTQVGPKGALRIDATRDGKTMTGTIRVTIWWQVDDEGVLKIVDHGEDYRLPFTARRLR